MLDDHQKINSCLEIVFRNIFLHIWYFFLYIKSSFLMAYYEDIVFIDNIY